MLKVRHFELLNRDEEKLKNFQSPILKLSHFSYQVLVGTVF